MGRVTGVVLVTSCIESTTILSEINAWLIERLFPGLRRVEESMCTGKHPRLYVSGGALNYFDGHVAAFTSLVASRPWLWPESVVLLIHGEEQEISITRPNRANS